MNDEYVKNGVGSLDRLRKRLERNPDFLTELGFDEFDIEDIQNLVDCKVAATICMSYNSIFEIHQPIDIFCRSDQDVQSDSLC